MGTAIKNVMIIDDSTLDLYIASSMVKNNNFAENVLEFSQAGKALLYLQDNLENYDKLPQVIFLDIYMPFMTGFEFMECYAKLPTELKRHCRVYILSSTIADADIKLSLIDSNTASFLVKPLTKEFLDDIAAQGDRV